MVSGVDRCVVSGVCGDRWCVESGVHGGCGMCMVTDV